MCQRLNVADTNASVLTWTENPTIQCWKSSIAAAVPHIRLDEDSLFKAAVAMAHIRCPRDMRMVYLMHILLLVTQDDEFLRRGSTNAAQQIKDREGQIRASIIDIRIKNAKGAPIGKWSAPRSKNASVLRFDADMCAICRSPLVADRRWIDTFEKCKHSFHTSCLRRLTVFQPYDAGPPTPLRCHRGEICCPLCRGREITFIRQRLSRANISRASRLSAATARPSRPRTRLSTRVGSGSIRSAHT